MEKFTDQTLTWQAHCCQQQPTAWMFHQWGWCDPAQWAVWADPSAARQETVTNCDLQIQSRERSREKNDGFHLSRLGTRWGPQWYSKSLSWYPMAATIVTICHNYFPETLVNYTSSKATQLSMAHHLARMLRETHAQTSWSESPSVSQNGLKQIGGRPLDLWAKTYIASALIFHRFSHWIGCVGKIHQEPIEF